ncbi:MAG TPA: T9SS type A sorting domain-containing protein [Bacteroidales bacterium]|nr:T9SS type A sorting domain-containing protein [Bacteroidales bacterium]HPI85065.1 T9SS type A sorting domain-containing protein [Bacteroidales bacterium]
MRRLILLSITLLVMPLLGLAQITITSEDMPVPGDTVRKSFTTFLQGFEYQVGGADQTWYFDELTVVSQQVDTFVEVEETPAIYQLFFNNQFIYPDYNSTVALKMAEFTAIPGLVLSDSYQFIKVTDDEYREVGYGVNLEGVSLPIQLQEIDTIYRFPVEYGDIDSAHSLLEIEVPDLGYLMVSKFRRNTVDGWGTLITPYGEFETLRMRTEITEYDSIYSDSLGIGMPLLRNIIEYKWLANGYPEPLLVISEEPFLLTATYIDSVRTDFVSTPEIIKNDFQFSLYPNPANNHVSVEYELAGDADVQISLLSVYGIELKRFLSAQQEQGLYKKVIYLKESGIPPGLYFLSLVIDQVPYTRKLIIN